MAKEILQYVLDYNYCNKGNFKLIIYEIQKVQTSNNTSLIEKSSNKENQKEVWKDFIALTFNEDLKKSELFDLDSILCNKDMQRLVFSSFTTHMFNPFYLILNRSSEITNPKDIEKLNDFYLKSDRQVVIKMRDGAVGSGNIFLYKNDSQNSFQFFLNQINNIFLKIKKMNEEYIKLLDKSDKKHLKIFAKIKESMNKNVPLVIEAGIMYGKEDKNEKYENKMVGKYYRDIIISECKNINNTTNYKVYKNILNLDNTTNNHDHDKNNNLKEIGYFSENPLKVSYSENIKKNSKNDNLFQALRLISQQIVNYKLRINELKECLDSLKVDESKINSLLDSLAPKTSFLSDEDRENYIIDLCDNLANQNQNNPCHFFKRNDKNFDDRMVNSLLKKSLFKIMNKNSENYLAYKGTLFAEYEKISNKLKEINNAVEQDKFIQDSQQRILDNL